jgi:hypothetical protein
VAAAVVSARKMILLPITVSVYPRKLTRKKAAARLDALFAVPDNEAGSVTLVVVASAIEA